MVISKEYTLISTVGTSLLGNLKRAFEQENLSEDDIRNIGFEKRADFERAKRHYCSSNWKTLGRALTVLSEEQRLCGAEINSIAALIKDKGLSFWRIIFLVSDTEMGTQTGELLKAFFDEKKGGLGIQKVEYRSIEKLQDTNPEDFRSAGLRNLVREIGKIFEGEPNLAIDATGGYKAQIAIAVLMGVALDIDVYYKHERFNTIISFPALPVSFDYEIIGEYGHVLNKLERNAILPDDEVGPLDEKLKVLLDDVEIDGEIFWALSVIGSIFLTGFRYRNRPRISLPSAIEEQRKRPNFPEHHYPKKFRDYVLKVWERTSWIKTCIVDDYSGQAGMKETGFELRKQGDKFEGMVVVGVYVDRDNFAGRFKVLTTGESKADLVWAVDYLNRTFGE